VSERYVKMSVSNAIRPLKLLCGDLDKRAGAGHTTRIVNVKNDEVAFFVRCN